MGATSSGRGLSVASLLALAVLVVTVGSLVATGVVALRAGERGNDEVVRELLGSVRETRANQLSSYLRRTQVQTAGLAGSATAAAAMVRFTAAYRGLAQAGPLGAADQEVLESFYADEFLPELARIPGADALDSMLPEFGAAAYLQRHYVAEPTAESKDAVNDAGDGSEWSAVHAGLHPALRNFADQLGYGDLYLIEPEELAIVYSVRKAPDFATRLDLGPYSGTALAGVVTEVVRESVPGAVLVTDLAPYPPALHHPETFFASPIWSGRELIGVLAVRLSGQGIDQIMTSGGDWAGTGLGATGEAYVVGPDLLMRSVSRAFRQDEAAYLEAGSAAGTIDGEQHALMAATGTTALVQQVPRGAVAAGRKPVSATSYRGTEVLTTADDLRVAGLRWVVITEISRDEASAAREDYRRWLMVGIAVLVIAVTFFAVVWAGCTMRPLRALSTAVRRLRGGDAGPAPTSAMAVPPGSPREFTTLADRVTRMSRSLHEGEQRVRDATVRRLELLRSLLPPQIVQRVERGDRGVIDQVPAATVAVLILSGLGELARADGGGGHRELIGREVEVLAALATKHGLEPVKLTGDAYFAACGLGRLYLDHTVRALTFAVAARDAIRSLRTTEDPAGLDLAVGVATGPVTVGLAGASRLLYDLWGETVSTAHYLARTARPGQVLATAAVADVRLPADLTAAQRSDALSGAGANRGAGAEATDLAESVWEVRPA